MGIRTAVIGPLEAARLRGYQAGVAEHGLLAPATMLRRRDVLYASMIQAGVDKIKLLTPDESTSPTAEALRARLQISWSGRWADCFAVVYEAFEPYRQTIPPGSSSVEAFLVEFLYALHARDGMISFAGVPTQTEVNALPPELAVPIANLFQSFRPIAPNVPNIQSVESADGARFEQVLTSALFVDYERAASELENEALAPSRAVVHVEKAGRRLVAHNKGLLRTSTLPMLLLSVTAKLVDAVLGALPGKLASATLDVAKPLLGGDRRVIIYDMATTAAKAFGRAR
jgi:hypothetical protein